MSWRFMEEDPVLGLRRWFNYDPSTKTCTIKTESTRLAALLDANGEALKSSSGTKFGDAPRRVASVPLHIASRELWEATRQKDENYLRKWLNDPDHAKFRTFAGSI